MKFRNWLEENDFLVRKNVATLNPGNVSYNNTKREIGVNWGSGKMASRFLKFSKRTVSPAKPVNLTKSIVKSIRGQK